MFTARILRSSRILIGLAIASLVIYNGPPSFLQRDNDPEPFIQDPVVIIERNDAPKPLGKHHYRPDGLMEVNPDGPHPIFELMQQAESDWKDKLYRASSSLDEAVQEYRRRYRRDPPKGFDDWWDYVQLHDVQLPDEYDQIHHDLEPFWGMKPTELLKIRSDLEAHVDSYTLGKTEMSQVDVVNTSYSNEDLSKDLNRRLLIDLLREVDDFLPPFRAVFSPHDNPNRMTDYDVKAATLDAARHHTYIGNNALPRTRYRGWASACSPSAPLSILYPFNLDGPPPAKPKKTFIYDHHLVMDPCLHPDHLWHHGQFLSHNTGPGPQETMVPEFSYCSTTVHHDIRIPTPYMWADDILPRSDDPEWDDKLDERLLWRGTNTGIYHSDDTRWKTSHRNSFVGTANDLNGTVDILPTSRSRFEPVGNAKKIRKAHLNPSIFDVAFAGSPGGCAAEMCKRLESIYPWRQYQNLKQAGNYKYVLDMDGNGWSGRFKRLITSNSVVFKSTIYPEWYTGRIAPWLHYVPVQLDQSDLHDALVFFRGDANGDGGHEDMARKIASAGRDWSKRFWRREDMVAYLFRLFLEYGRLMSVDRDAMSFKGDGFRE